MRTGWMTTVRISIPLDGVTRPDIPLSLRHVRIPTFIPDIINSAFVNKFRVFPAEEDIKNTTVCPTPGCRGIGHVKAKHPVHHIILSCPYSSMNYLRDDHIPDRFCSKREYYEVKETSSSKGWVWLRYNSFLI